MNDATQLKLRTSEDGNARFGWQSVQPLSSESEPTLQSGRFEKFFASRRFEGHTTFLPNRPSLQPQKC
jgi:hypothetical protein